MEVRKRAPRPAVVKGQPTASSAAAPPKTPNTAASWIRVSPQTQKIIVFLLLFRLANAFLVRTFFQPDEYYQALEPAWQMAFGSESGAWLTWEWEYQLRSSLHPRLFAAAYIAVDKVADLLHLPSPLKASILVGSPRAVQSVIAAASDFFTWRFAESIYGEQSNTAWVALFMSILNPFQWYCSIRTFSNSLEMTLTVAALSFWPWELLGEPQASWSTSSPPWGLKLKTALFLAATAVLLRPTNLLIWLPIAGLLVSKLLLSPRSQSTAFSVVKDAAFCGSDVLAVSLISDYFFYGAWTFPPAKWLHFNLAQSLAIFYGRNPWHYYLSQGLPLLCTTYLPWVVLGLYRTVRPATTALPSEDNNKPQVEARRVRSLALRSLAAAVASTLVALSLISHKEVRFVYPLLPILHVVAAPHAAASFTELRLSPPPSSGRGAGAGSKPARHGLKHVPQLAFFLGINALLVFFLSQLHQPAVVEVASFLRHEFERVYPDHLSLQHPGSEATTTPPPPRPAAPFNGSYAPAAWMPGRGERFALFLMPCHSVPWRSHLVYPSLSARALTCEPPLHTAPGSAERAAYEDEADEFYNGGASFVRALWPPDGPPSGAELPPRYVVGFEGVEPALRLYFQAGHGGGDRLGVRLTRAWEGWNGWANEDWRRRGKVVVWSTGIWDLDDWGEAKAEGGG